MSETIFRTRSPAQELVTKTTVEKGHGRIETRTYVASSKVDWIVSDQSYPGQPRFITNIKTLLEVHSRTEHADRCTFDTRYFHLLRASRHRAHGQGRPWSLGALKSMHWLLDVEFGDDLSRYPQRTPAPKNMAVVRRFALGLVRANKAKGSVKTRRKSAGWNPQLPARNPPA